MSRVLNTKLKRLSKLSNCLNEDMNTYWSNSKFIINSSAYG